MSNAKKTVEALEAGRRIKRARDVKGFSVPALVRATGGKLTTSRIGNYEQGTRQLGVYEARVLAAPLEVHPAWLMGVVSDDEHRFLQALRNGQKALALKSDEGVLPALSAPHQRSTSRKRPQKHRHPESTEA